MRHREEALAAIETAEKMLIAPTLTALDQRLALTALDEAKAHVAAIEETKRPRRKKETP